MSRQYFGTDGVRGTVGQPPMTPDFVLRLGQAAGLVLGKHQSGGRLKVVIGKDTRVSGYMIESCLEAGFISVGVDVVMVGPMPTAGIAYLARVLGMSAGVVISASHNPFPDNGIKFFSGEGTKLPDEWELEIEAQLELTASCKPSDQLGKAKRLDDASGRYIEFCKSTFPRTQDLRDLSLVVDCANGAAYQVAPAVFQELGAEVHVLANQPDGLNINHNVGATHPQAMVEAVLAHRADYGFALDGDADRLICADQNGRVYNGDELLYALVVDRLDRGLPVPGVVGTLMTNLGLGLALKALGVELVRAKVGDRYVFEQLVQRDWTLGGESSGHLLALDSHSTGDGIVSALLVLRAVLSQKKPLAEILKPLQLMPQVLKSVRVPPGYNWQADHALQAVCSRVEKRLGATGRLLIRPSGTEPVLRVMIESPHADVAEEGVQEIMDAISQPKSAAS